MKGKLEEAEETLKNLKTVAAKIETTSMKGFRDTNLADIEENAIFIRKNFELCQTRMNELKEIIPLPENNNVNSKSFNLRPEQLPACIRLDFP